MQEVRVHMSMSLVHTLPHTMHLRRVTATQVGRDSGYSQPAISKYRTGAAKIPLESVPSLMRAFPEQGEEILLDVAHQFSEFLPPVMNGSAISENPLSRVVMLVPQLQQAVTAVNNSLDELSGPADSIHGADDPEEAVLQILDASFYGYNAAIAICHTFGFSMQDLANQREKYWKHNKLVR